ncbi:hypothetical protein GWI33_021610 [Rhynchophorus ferrugineus]|uniref:Nose resistant-to-fluoxetine protein N-terminal domain-containing protein n=1 Tax=Rhynchophorus ferrugineus TaxID=354439 RepID=A0A834IVM6_RHYFE|nr:hypothetical protein GWI33_021610 [Rhynchophorus ferrugineus]
MNVIKCLLLFCFVFSAYSILPFYVKFLKLKAAEILDRVIPAKSHCSQHIKTLITDALQMKKLWALRMLDASAKLQPGILNGLTHNLGNFDQCIAIRTEEGDGPLIEGQYCTVLLTFEKNNSRNFNLAHIIQDEYGIMEGMDLDNLLKFVNIIYGVCLPKSCSTTNIQKLWNYIENTLKIPLHVTLNDNLCIYKGKVPFVYGFDYYVFLAAILFGAFVGLATMYDVLIYQYVEDPRNIFLEDCLVAFSLNKNLRKVLERPKDTNEDIFGCMSGLKVISMICVVYGHRFAFNTLHGNINMIDIFEWRKTFPALFLLMAPFAVDTFLAISGLLLAYKYMQIRDILPRGEPVPWYIFYLMRITRLSPALLATILFYVSIIKYITDGPLWSMIVLRSSHFCRYTGWLTLTFTNNWMPKYMCVPQSWYLSMDSQLYMMAPLVTMGLVKYPRKTITLLLALSFLSRIYTHFVTIHYKLSWTLLEMSRDFKDYMFMVYGSTFSRLPVWVFGVITGYLLYHYQHIRIHKPLVIVLWSCSICMPLAIALISNLMIREPYNEHTSAMYNSLTGPLWSLAICTIIFLCSTGHGGIFNEILSWKPFKIVVRFSYSIYLVHFTIIAIFEGSKRSVTSNDSFKSLHDFLGDLPFTLGMGLVWCLLFESPFINISKLCFKYKYGEEALRAASNHGRPKMLVVYSAKHFQSLKTKKQ